MSKDVLAQQLSMNRQTWDRLLACGFRSGSSANLDYSFVARNRPAAVALCADLTASGRAAAAQAGGWFFARRWYVTGNAPEPALTLERLDEWVTEMVGCGNRHGCVFDGWGMAIDG